MLFKLTRIIKASGYTIGRLQTNIRSYWTLEDTVREIEGKPVSEWKKYGVTAIPKGRYELIVTMSNRFKKPLPLLVDVPGYAGVRIHSGNTSEDTEGCILIGNNVNMDEGRIGDSRAAMIDFMDELDHLYDSNVSVELEIA
jgi:hypothetical protein